MSRKKKVEQAATAPVAPTEQPTGAGSADPAASAVDVGAGDTGQDAQPSAGEVVGQLAGVQRHDGTVVELKDMSEAELRQLADALEIAGADHHPLGQVIEAIQAEEVLVPAASDQDHIYLVNRELLEHDGERYAFGDQVVIEDETAAAALLALGAIVREGE